MDNLGLRPLQHMLTFKDIFYFLHSCSSKDGSPPPCLQSPLGLMNSPKYRTYITDYDNNSLRMWKLLRSDIYDAVLSPFASCLSF